MTLMTKAQILGNIKTIATRGNKLDQLIQNVAVSIVAHVGDHREASLVCKLYNAMPKGSRRLALAHWFVKYGAVKVNPSKVKGESEAIPFLFDATATTFVEEAGKNFWFDGKKEKTLREEFDVDLALANFGKVLERAIKAGKLEAGDVRVRDTLSQATAAAERIKAAAKVVAE